MYEVLVLVHILSGMVWVGGGFVLVLVERHARYAGGDEEADRMIRRLEWTDDWIFTPAPLLVIATGVTMVIMNDAWAFSQPWVYLALGLILVEFVTGYRDLQRMKASREMGTGSPEYEAALRSYFRFAPVAIAILGVIVVLMVYKPGV
jgi:uncharacterized membrane protein